MLLLIILSLSQNSNLTQVADSIAQLTESTDDLDANDVGIIAGFVEEIATEATQNEEVRLRKIFKNILVSAVVHVNAAEHYFIAPLYSMFYCCVSTLGKKGLFGYT